MMKKNFFANQDGFSFVELLVAVSLFSFIMLITIGVFQQVVESQRSALAAQNIQESMRYTLEVLSKEIRQAKRSDNQCLAGAVNRIFNVAAGNTELYFKNKHNECVHYYIKDNILMVERDGVEASTTPNEIIVSGLEFGVQDNIIDVLPADKIQPRVTMRIKAEMNTAKEMHKQPLVLQTTISSRYYE